MNLYFICLAQSLKCQVNSQNAESIKIESKECKPDHVCGYTTKEGEDTIVRECISKQNESYPMQIGKCFKTLDWTLKKGMMICACDTDNCNHECSAEKCPECLGEICESTFKEECDANCKAPEGVPEKNETKPTDTTITNDKEPSPTDDSAGATTKDVPQPTDDSAGATGEEGPQPTGDDNGTEEAQESTGKAATNSGNLRVLESNKFVFAIGILVTLVIRSFDS